MIFANDTVYRSSIFQRSYREYRVDIGSVDYSFVFSFMGNRHLSKASMFLIISAHEINTYEERHDETIAELENEIS